MSKKQIDALTYILDVIIDDYDLEYDYEISDLDETIHFDVEVYDRTFGKEKTCKSMSFKVTLDCCVWVEVGEDCWEPVESYGCYEMNFWKAFLEWPW